MTSPGRLIVTEELTFAVVMRGDAVIVVLVRGRCITTPCCVCTVKDKDYTCIKCPDL